MPDSALPDTTVLTSSFYETYIRPQVIVACTSATRPTGVEGRKIYETDTDLEYTHDGTNWILTGGTAGWTSWTPTVTQSGAVTKTVTRAVWARTDRRTIHFYCNLAITGSGTAANTVQISLPVAAASSGFVVPGGSYITDASASLNYGGMTYLNTTTTCAIAPALSTGSAFGLLGAVGFTAALASGDILFFSGTYDAAA